jgi:hypothetical protein
MQTAGDEQRAADDVFRQRMAGTNGRRRIPAANSRRRRTIGGVYASSEGWQASWARAIDGV